MAKKRSKKKGTKRRKVGALALSPNSMLVKYGSIAAGFFAGDKIIDPLLAKIMPATLDPKLVAAGETGLGALLAFGPGKKSTLRTFGGGLLLGAGLKNLAQEFGIMNGIGGYGSVPVVGRRRVGGYGNVPVAGNYTPSTMLGGALNGGYTVPRPVHKSVVGSTENGSGINNDSRN